MGSGLARAVVLEAGEGPLVLPYILFTAALAFFRDDVIHLVYEEVELVTFC